MKRRGFTLIELLVVVAIIALLIAILLPSLGKAKELSNRSVCAANVRGIMQSMVVYSADNSESYPYLGPAAINAKAPTGNTAGNLMNDMFYLVGSGSVAPKQFVCKSDNYAQPSNSPASSTANVWGYNPTYWNNGGTADFSYSYSFAFQYVNGNILANYWRNSMDAGCPIAGDMNPGTAVTFPKTTKNSHTHNDEGENVGYGDAHAEFTRNPNVGENNDNIYSTGGNNTNVSTGTPTIPATGNIQGSFDTCLVPGITNTQYQRG